jgi:hypothetical protein
MTTFSSQIFDTILSAEGFEFSWQLFALCSIVIPKRELVVLQLSIMLMVPKV